METCPLGVIILGDDGLEIDRQTCDRCMKCVEVCPTGARKFGSMKDETSEVYKILKGPGVLTVLKKEMGTFPALYYKGARREVV